MSTTEATELLSTVGLPVATPEGSALLPLLTVGPHYSRRVVREVRTAERWAAEGDLHGAVRLLSELCSSI